MTTRLSVEAIVQKVDQLPELPQAALRVSQMLEDPEVSADELAQIIRLDPNLTGQLLRMCNSAAYGLNRQISTVKEAVAILGLKVLKSLVYAVISHTALDHPMSGYALEKGALWKNAVSCAVYAKHIAEYHRYIDPEQAFTGAILRDLGKIVLEEYVGANYAEIEAYARKHRVDFMQAEMDILGTNHTLVGMRVAEKWNLPPTLISVIGFHHRPSALPADVPEAERKLVGYVHLADAFSMMLGLGVGSDGLMYSLDTAYFQTMGITMDELYVQNTLARLLDLQETVNRFSESLSS
ncbi:MAG: HDOD domain-containing protein [Candidatus Melainabacteria bacterium]|nr:HDOD domain-containing protein [Candidatus Melainabacteria bacterium]